MMDWTDFIGKTTAVVHRGARRLGPAPAIRVHFLFDHPTDTQECGLMDRDTQLPGGHEADDEPVLRWIVER